MKVLQSALAAALCGVMTALPTLAHAADPVRAQINLVSEVVSNCATTIDQSSLSFSNTGSRIDTAPVQATITVTCNGQSSVPVSVKPTNGFLQSTSIGSATITYALQVNYREGSAASRTVRASAFLTNNTLITLPTISVSGGSSGTSRMDLVFRQQSGIAPAVGDYSETVTVTFG